jgi:two-component system response regulator VicR
MRKILIAEDNIEISDIMRNYLLKAGHTVYQAFNGEDALTMARSLRPDLLLLDIMMPIVDGYKVCETLRKEMSMPIIVVSAKVAEEDKIRLFDLGADDYITKPFSNKEMICRVNAQLRRYFDLSKQVRNGTRSYGALTINADVFEVKVNGKPVAVTAKEFKILDFLTYNANMILGKQKIIDEVWGVDDYIDENTVAVTIARLREKLQKEGVDNIVTVWGLGYKWQD